MIEMTFKLIARDNKINIYDPYSDKYHVVEDDDELNKLVDSDGKLLPDEQLRQYFNSKESKYRKIQKGFVTRKANLKKEYADVAKSTFNDVVKSKLYSTYGDVLSNEDINAFNKNPSIATIKSFKSINKDIKNDMQNLFKSNETTFNQDFQDKNNFASLLSEIANLNSQYLDNYYNRRTIAYQAIKKDLEAFKESKDERIKADIKRNIGNTLASMDNVSTDVVNELNNLTDETVDNVMKSVDKQIDVNNNKAQSVDANKFIFTKDNITFKNDSYKIENALQQFNDSKTIRGYNMEPLQSLRKNLSYINHKYSNDFEDFKDKIAIDINEDNGFTDYDIKFGKSIDGQPSFNFHYHINNDTPYFNLMKDDIEALKDNIDSDKVNDFHANYQKMIDDMVKIDASEYTQKMTDTSKDNKMAYVNNRLKDVDELFDENSLEWKLVEQISNPVFTPTDFEQYIKALDTKGNFPTEPIITFNKDNEDKAFAYHQQVKKSSKSSVQTPNFNPFIHEYRLENLDKEDRHMYNQKINEIIDKGVNDVDTVKLLGDLYDRFKVKGIEKNKFIEFYTPHVKGAIIANVINRHIPEPPRDNSKKLAYPTNFAPMALAVPNDKKKGEYILDDTVKGLFTGEKSSMPDILKKLPTLYKDKNYLTIITDDKVINTLSKSVDNIVKDVDDNLNKAYYWYYKYNTVTNDRPPVYIFDEENSEPVSRIPPLTQKNSDNVHVMAKNYNQQGIDKYQPINVIQRDLYTPYALRNLSQNTFYGEGSLDKQIRDMLILKLNSN